MTKLKVTNHTDLQNAYGGLLPPNQVRSEELEALVDAGATGLVLPADVVARLGFREEGTKKVRYADGHFGIVPWVGGVRIEILGREMTCDALVHPAGTTPLIGQIPLEGLDLVVDPKSRAVMANPANPDAPVLDILAAG